MVTGLLGLAALVAVAASPAQAAFVVGGENGWQMSFDGMINVFGVYDTKSSRTGGNNHYNIPDSDSGITGLYQASPAEQSFRIRTGLLPSIFAFNVKSPTINGVDYAARIGLYPQIENAGTRSGLGPGMDNGGTSIDIREVFFTADGCFGQVLAGRALNLYLGKNILTDMTLIGLGVPLNMTGEGVSLGFIGRGYPYPSFGPQFRYTTPDMNGFKVAVSINDPGRITGKTAVVGDASDPSEVYEVNRNYEAKVLNQPRFETEISYAKTFKDGKVQVWLNGLFQEAGMTASEPYVFRAGAAPTLGGPPRKVTSIGGGGGVQVVYGPFETTISTFGGQALGLTLIQDGFDALDYAGSERLTVGGLAHITYTIGGKTKLGAQYGISYAQTTEFDQRMVNDNNGDLIKKSQQGVTAGVYHSLTKNLTLVGEYTYALDQWYDGSKQNQNIISVGTVFTW